MYGYTGIFHEKLMKTLINSIKNNHNGHAYIFEGADGLDQSACAELFANALTCTSSVVPCGVCPACVQARAKTNPDIIRISTAKNKKSIGVEQVRDIVSDAYIKPFECPRKVYIIEKIDAMTEQAQNAFLKILEEPPSYTVFIMLATTSAPLLQTVLSRSMLINFPPLTENELLNYIKTNYPTEQGRAEFLAKYARGIPGVVDDVVTNELFEPLRQNSFNALELMLSSSKLDTYEVVEFMETNKDSIDLILDFWSDMLRDMLFIQCGEKSKIINSDMLSVLEKKSYRTKETVIVKALEGVIHTRELLRRYISLKAVALNLILKVKQEII